MAIGRLSVGTGKKGKAAPHALYIFREEKYAKPDDDLEILEHTEHGNMPKWAQAEPNFFWKSADTHERKNGSTYREHVISLPRELRPRQRLALIHEWIEQEIGDKHAYQFAIHNPMAMDGREQPHCHLMFSERTRDSIERDPDQYFKRYNAKNPEKGGLKKANTGMQSDERKTLLIEQRERWEQLCNKHLELANMKARISMKSFKDRNVNSNYKPLNLTMSQLNNPDIKAQYKAHLNAKKEVVQSLRERTKIDVSKELERLRLMPSPTDQHQKADAEPLPIPPTRIERLKEDPAFFAYAITHFNEFTEERKAENDGFYFDVEQQQELETLTDALYRNRSVNTRATGDWQEDIKNGVAWLIEYNSKYIETNEELSKALDIALDPDTNRRKAKENAPELEQKTVKSEENELVNDVQTKNTAMRMRR